MGGNADDLVRPQLGPDVHIVLPHMNAVGVHGLGDIHIVIDNEGNVPLPAQCLKFSGFFQKFFLRQRFFPQLEHGHAAVQAFPHHVDELAAVQPVTVGNGVQQQILFIALHTWLLHSAFRHPYCKWRR